MDDVIRGGVCRFVMLDCIADTSPGIASKNSMAVTVTVTVNVTVTVTVTVTATVTVTVTVNRLGVFGPGCASCGLLYGYYEARRVEGWLSMLLRQGRLYFVRNKLMLNVPLLFKSK